MTIETVSNRLVGPLESSQAERDTRPTQYMSFARLHVESKDKACAARFVIFDPDPPAVALGDLRDDR